MSPEGAALLEAVWDVLFKERRLSPQLMSLFSSSPPFPGCLPQSFERVLVENKLHGLSPALSEAIQSISRWELVQAALPHVLHCTSILLSNRNKLGEDTRRPSPRAIELTSLIQLILIRQNTKLMFFRPLVGLWLWL